MVTIATKTANFATNLVTIFLKFFRQMVPSSNASGRLKSFTACLCGESGRRYTVLAGNRVKATHVGL